MNEMIVREAHLGDMNTLIAFEQGIINAEREFDETLRPGDIHYYDIEEMICTEHAVVAVAVLDDQIIGCGFARIEQSKPYLRHSHHAYLGLMFVDAEHRGKGVNKLIVDFLMHWAASKNITELRLEVYAGNASAIRAYEKRGFTRHMIEMRMSVDQQ